MELVHRYSGLKQRTISVEPKGFFASKNDWNDSNIWNVWNGLQYQVMRGW
jgi:hypothetical protein